MSLPLGAQETVRLSEWAQEDHSQAEGQGRGALVGRGTGDTHTIVHTTQGNWNQTVYFTAWGSPAPLIHHGLSGRIIQVPGATFEN